MHSFFRFILFRRAVLLLFALGTFYSPSLFAQNQGAPYFEKLTYYTVSGGAFGLLAGGAWWLADPLNESNNLGVNLATGFAVGCIVGFIVGVEQLYSSSVDDPYLVYNSALHRPVSSSSSSSSSSELPPALLLSRLNPASAMNWKDPKKSAIRNPKFMVSIYAINF